MIPITFPTHGNPGGPGGNGKEVLRPSARRATYKTTRHAKANVLVAFQSYIARGGITMANLCMTQGRAQDVENEYSGVRKQQTTLRTLRRASDD